MIMFKKGDMVIKSDRLPPHVDVYGAILDGDGNYTYRSNGFCAIDPIDGSLYLVLDTFQEDGKNYLKVFCCKTLKRWGVNSQTMMRAK